MKMSRIKIPMILLILVVSAMYLTILPVIPAFAETTETTADEETTPAVDFSNESNASLRMRPLKEKLASLTESHLSTELNKYKDIQAHWSKTQVCKLSSLEIIKGYSDNTFKPEKSVTVAEFITMAVKILGYKLELNPKYWAQSFIDQAINDGIINDGEFADYNKAITREEVARIAVNVAMLYDTAPTHEMVNVVKKRLGDYDTIKDVNKQKVIDANLLGLMTTYNTGKFMPRNELTRAEAATVILRLLDSSTRLPFVPKTTEMIKITDRYTNEVRYLVNNNKQEVLPMLYKMIDATKLSKGYADITPGVEDKTVGIALWDSKEKADNNMYGWDIDIVVQLIPISTVNDMEHPYTMVIRNPQNTKMLHMDFMKELFKMFYGTDADKVLAEFNKCLEDAINGTGEDYQLWTYKSGIKFGGRGIFLVHAAGDPEIVIWFSSK